MDLNNNIPVEILIFHSKKRWNSHLLEEIKDLDEERGSSGERIILIRPNGWYASERVRNGYRDDYHKRSILICSCLICGNFIDPANNANLHNLIFDSYELPKKDTVCKIADGIMCKNPEHLLFRYQRDIQRDIDWIIESTKPECLTEKKNDLDFLNIPVEIFIFHLEKRWNSHLLEEIKDLDEERGSSGERGILGERIILIRPNGWYSSERVRNRYRGYERSIRICSCLICGNFIDPANNANLHNLIFDSYELAKKDTVCGIPNRIMCKNPEHLLFRYQLDIQRKIDWIIESTKPERLTEKKNDLDFLKLKLRQGRIMSKEEEDLLLIEYLQSLREF